MSCEPQQWSSPADIMKRRKLKKKSKSLTGEYPIKNGTPFSQFVNKGGGGVKRSNPFSCNNSVNKKRAIVISEKGQIGNSLLDSVCSNSETEEISQVLQAKRSPNDQPVKNSLDTGNDKHSRLFSSLDTVEEVTNDDFNTTPVLSRNVSVFQDKGRQFNERIAFCAESFEEKDDPVHQKTQKEAVKGDETNCEASLLEVLPIDWCIKGKLRVSSEQSLACCVQMKSTDEAVGLNDYVGSKEQWSAYTESSFHRCCLYWQHPNIPWTKLFPRIVSDSKISRVNVIGSNEDMKKCLYTDWSDSFTSAFHQLRSNYSPYFYLCSYQFTVLFRGVGVTANNSISALLTPTTRGLREALKIEGIEFKMPLLDKKKSAEDEKENEIALSNKTDENTQCSDLIGEEDDGIDTDEGASVWLESMGIDKKQFPSLDPNKVKIQKEGYKRVDNRPESMVYVEGSEVQALYNFLLNCRSCIASSGEQGGIPPTILSPSPFRGATLKSNKVKHSSAKQTDSQGNSYKSHILEINGPILPHNVLNMAALLRQNLDQQFSFTCNNHEPTAPFNINLNHTSSDKPAVNNVNLHADCEASLYSEQKYDRDVCFLKTIVGSKDGFRITI